MSFGSMFIDWNKAAFFKYPLGIEINLKGIFLLSDIQGGFAFESKKC